MKQVGVFVLLGLCFVLAIYILPSKNQETLIQNENHTAQNKKLGVLEDEVYHLNQEILKLQIELDDFRSQQASHAENYRNLNDQQEMIIDNQNVNPEHQNSKNTEENITLEEDPEQQELSPEERVAELDGKMLLEGSDQRWEAQAADEIETGFENAGLENASLDSAYCRGSICRMEISYADETELAKLFEGVDPIVPWPHKGQAHTINDHSGSIRTIFYLTRK